MRCSIAPVPKRMHFMNTLLENFLSTRSATERLCAPLNVEDYIPQAVDYTSPPKWHLAHVSWFFEEMILKHYLKGYEVFDSQYAFLFNSYYQSMGERSARGQRGVITRPTVDDVYRYRQHVDEHMLVLLEGELSDQLSELVTLGINHEQQHQELLLTDLKYTLSLNPTFPVYEQGRDLVAQHNAESGWLEFGEQIQIIGHSGDGFCFDNELGEHRVLLPDYQIAKNLVTNAEFIEFINDGGYQECQYWLDEGWSWVCEKQIDSPLYWHKRDGSWFYYTLAGLQTVDPDAILAHVSYYEANAFASWKGHRLPTEFEWEAASSKLCWGQRWEWTDSAYRPYPGYAIDAGAVGEYNGKFMINQMVLRGASTATAKGHSRHTYRNFFHPHLQWQISGIRLAK